MPGSQRSLAIMTGEEHYQAFGQLLYSVQTGKTAFDKLYGMPVFDFLQKHPEQAKIFDEAMVGVHGRETAAMLDAYDFSGIRVLADVGGGNGSVLTPVLKKHPAMRGILFDMPGVVERAKANIQAAGLADRCQVIGGSFFESVPAGADAYLMRHIIHDWDDEKATKILRNIHQAMGRRQVAGRGERDPARQRAVFRQTARPDDAGHSRRRGTDGRGIPEAATSRRLPPDPNRADEGRGQRDRREEVMTRSSCPVRRWGGGCFCGPLDTTARKPDCTANQRR